MIDLKPRESILLLLLSVFILNACVKDKFGTIDGVNYEPAVAFALGTATFELESFIEDDSIFTVDNDGLIQISYREDSITSLSLATFLDNFTDGWSSEFTKTESPGNLELADVEEGAIIPFSLFVNNFDDMATRQFFRNNEGTPVMIPAFSQQVDIVSRLNAFSEFRYLEIVSGNLEFTFSNGFAFPVENLELRIRDNISGQIIQSFTINYLGGGQIYNQSYSLAGLRLSNDISVEIPVLQTPGSSAPVVYHLDDELDIRIQMTDLQISGGEVKVPDFDFSQTSEYIDFETDENSELTEVSFSGGQLNFSFQSALSIPVEARITFPHLIRNGQPVSRNITFTDAWTGVIDLAGTELALDKDIAQPYNRILVRYEFSTPGTNDFVIFDAASTVQVAFGISRIAVENVFGRLGAISETLESNQLDFEFDFSILDEASKAIFFENPEIKIFYSNSFGVPLQADLQVSATGTFGQQANLNAPQFQLDYPNVQQVGQSIDGTFVLNSSNSNLKNLLATYPASITYGGQVHVNPAGNNSINFVTGQSSLQVGLEMNLPLTISAEALIFRDTLTNEPLENEVEEVVDATLVLDYSNDLPFDTKLTLYGDFDGTESPVIEDIQLLSAEVDNAGKVVGSKTGRLEISLSGTQIQQLFSAGKLYIQIQVNTAENGLTPVSLYIQNGIEVNAGIRANLKIN